MMMHVLLTLKESIDNMVQYKQYVKKWHPEIHVRQRSKTSLGLEERMAKRRSEQVRKNSGQE